MLLMWQVSSLIFVIAGFRAFLESNSCLMIIVGFNLFRNSFSMISMVFKYFIKFYRNIIAYGVSHSIRTQKHFRSSQVFGWSEATTELLLSCSCFREQAGWSESCVLIGYASSIELMQGIEIYKATKTENLPEASESRSSWKGFRQIITLDMIVYRSDLDLRSQIPPLLVWTLLETLDSEQTKIPLKEPFSRKKCQP